MAEATGEAGRVLHHWLTVLGPAGWYAGTPEIDAGVRAGFLPLWRAAAEGGLGHWLTDAEGALAYLVLTDQMPRNMFRGQAAAFATDANARAAAKMAIRRGWDMATPEPQRQFFYLPLEHSENLVDQDRSCALIGAGLADPGSLLHARAHRAVIRRFARFPGRNAALGRADTPAERAWLAAGGYGAEVRALGG